ncbi:MAG: hypothetical protein QXH91_07450, partial [Candidatus Bathyarchaeia archaeon]
MVKMPFLLIVLAVFGLLLFGCEGDDGTPTTSPDDLSQDLAGRVNDNDGQDDDAGERVWHIYTVDKGDVEENEDRGRCNSIALDSEDAVHISYRVFSPVNGEGDEGYNLKYATNRSGAWVATIVDLDENVGNDTSIAIDSNDYVHITYYGWANDALRYATNSSGSWEIAIVDSAEDTGYDSSVVLDGDDNVCVSYYADGSLKYATNAGGAWQYFILDGNDNAGWFTSMRLDASGYAHIAYYAVSELRYATNS